jgi:hypothetical protein
MRSCSLIALIAGFELLGLASFGQPFLLTDKSNNHMAVVKLSALLSSIKGSVGAATFQKSGNNIVLRQKPIIRNYPSQSQQDIRGYMSYLDSYWKKAPDSMRQLYNNAVNNTNWTSNYRKRRIYSGVALFKAYNLLRLMQGLSVLTSFTLPNLQVSSYINEVGTFQGGVLVVVLPSFADSDWQPVMYFSQMFTTSDKAMKAPTVFSKVTRYYVGFYYTLADYATIFGPTHNVTQYFKVECYLIHKAFPYILTVPPYIKSMVY